MKNLRISKFTLAYILFASHLAFSAPIANKCTDLFLTSNSIIEEIQKTKLTAGEVQVFSKKIPTILVNKESVADLNSIYEQSIGIVVAHQKGYRNDHGLFRLGQYFIDRDTPGRRQRGELHNTGLSWAPVSEYVNYVYKLPSTYNRIEVLFKLSKVEFNTVAIYQKMRRAAIIRPDFSFGPASNPDQVNNRMSDCGEICFSFSTGSAVYAQVISAQRHIQKMGLQNFSELSATSDFKKLFATAEDYFLNADLSEKKLNPDIFKNFDVPAAIDQLKLSADQQNELVRWVIGAYISKNYADLLTDLQITNASDYSNVRSLRASAVLVYDGNVSKQDFSNTNYISQGIFSVWKNTEFSPIQTSPQRKIFWDIF